ncbi:MAG: porin family protein [Flavisolibacter sp.]
MKKQILLFASLVVSTLVMAQQKPSFGIRGGLSSATMKGDAVNSLNKLLDFTNGAISTGSHTGVFGGVYVNLPLGGPVSVEPAVYYTQKGYALQGALNIKGADFLGANARAQLNARYIDMPVVLKANFGGFQVFGGPQVSYLTKADLHTTGGVLGFNIFNSTQDATSQFNRWDAGLTGGIGYQFSNGLNITAAYDHGLSKTDAGQNMKAYNRSFKVGIGFGF